MPANPSGGSFDPSRAVHLGRAGRDDPPDVGPLRVRSHAIDPRDPTLIRPSLTTLRAALCGIGLLAATSAFADATAACRALADSRALSAALIGTQFADAQAFDRVRTSMAAVDRRLGPDADVLGGSASARHFLASLDAHADVLLKQRDVVQQVHERLRAISHASIDLLEASETLESFMLQANASAAHLAAASQLAMLSMRLGRSADTFMGWEGVSPEAVFLLGKDLKTFDEILSGLEKGNAGLRLHAQRDPAVVRQLAKARSGLAVMQAGGQVILDDLQWFVAARAAQASLQQEADNLGHVLALACAGTDAGVTEPLKLPSQQAAAASAPAKSR